MVNQLGRYVIREENLNGTEMIQTEICMKFVGTTDSAIRLLNMFRSLFKPQKLDKFTILKFA